MKFQRKNAVSEIKKRILYKISHAATENPDNTVREVIFKGVSGETLNRIVDEFKIEKQEAGFMPFRIVLKDKRPPAMHSGLG